MKLFILFLTSLFFHSVDMLPCYECDTELCEKPYLVACDSDQYCASMRTDATFSRFYYSIEEKFCLKNVTCKRLNANGTKLIASVAVGRTSVTTILSCCHTLGCNKNNVDAPDKTPNGLKCKSCASFYDDQCDADIMCVGNQDHCLNDTASLLPYSFGFGNNTLKGCISRAFCQPSSLGNMNCCQGNLCNTVVSWLRSVNFSVTILSLLTVLLQL